MTLDGGSLSGNSPFGNISRLSNSYSEFQSFIFILFMVGTWMLFSES